MRKPKTQAQADRATDQRMLKVYGRGLDWYNEQFERQGGECAICHRPPTSRRLHIDHDHGWKKVKIETGRRYEGWFASAKYLLNVFISYAEKRSLAVRDLKNQLKRASIRGLLCYSHNAGLQKFQDNPDLLRNAAKYLENHRDRPLPGQEGE
jgi:hypothetical protein